MPIIYHIAKQYRLGIIKPPRSDEMKDLTVTAKEIKATLKTLGINAKTKSCRGFYSDAIFVTVADELVKKVYDLTKEYQTDCLSIIVQS